MELFYKLRELLGCPDSIKQKVFLKVIFMQNDVAVVIFYSKSSFS